MKRFQFLSARKIMM